jgi:hypothetical protein
MLFRRSSLAAASLASLLACSSATTSTPMATPDAGTPAEDAAPAVDASGSSGSSVTGTLGALGAAQSIVSSLVIQNSGETLVYLSSAPLPCSAIQASRWLGTLPAGTQVVELVMPGVPTDGQTVKVPPGEVNYAPGGKSSSYEKSSASGSIVWTKGGAGNDVSGTFSATLGTGDKISGSFAATFCANGQQY